MVPRGPDRTTDAAIFSHIQRYFFKPAAFRRPGRVRAGIPRPVSLAMAQAGGRPGYSGARLARDVLKCVPDPTTQGNEAIRILV
jgi:hypothetical protein